jgi:hypothetical protein
MMAGRGGARYRVTLPPVLWFWGHPQLQCVSLSANQIKEPACMGQSPNKRGGPNNQQVPTATL